MKYAHTSQRSKLYKYGPGEEFETKDDAKQQMQKDVGKTLTKFSIDNIWDLFEGREDGEEGNTLWYEIKFKYPVDVFEEENEGK